MALDEVLQQELKEAESLPPTYESCPEEARALRRANLRPADRSGLTVDDMFVPTSYGRVPIRIYRPEGFSSDSPVALFFHGSGWVVCDLDTHDDVVCQLTRASNCVFVSVDYPLAPEAKFPAGLEASYEVASWVQQNAHEIRADSSRLAVAGDSAGGNIAAVLCLLARDRGGPDISFQLLGYPGCDLDFDVDSYRENDEFGLDRKSVEWFADHYLNAPSERVDWRVSPLLAPSLAELPPTLLMVAEYDVLRDSGRAYADALLHAGNEITLVVEDRMNHGFWTSSVERAGQSLRECGLALGHALRATAPVGGTSETGEF